LRLAKQKPPEQRRRAIRAHPAEHQRAEEKPQSIKRKHGAVCMYLRAVIVPYSRPEADLLATFAWGNYPLDVSLRPAAQKYHALFSPNPSFPGRNVRHIDVVMLTGGKLSN